MVWMRLDTPLFQITGKHMIHDWPEFLLEFLCQTLHFFSFLFLHPPSLPHGVVNLRWQWLSCPLNRKREPSRKWKDSIPEKVIWEVSNWQILPPCFQVFLASFLEFLSLAMEALINTHFHISHNLQYLKSNMKIAGIVVRQQKRYLGKWNLPDTRPVVLKVAVPLALLRELFQSTHF